MNKLKNYSVNVFVNGEYYDCLDVFGGDTPEDNLDAFNQANEYADAYRGDQEWFDEFTDYEFTHADDNWVVIVEESNA